MSTATQEIELSELRQLVERIKTLYGYDFGDYAMSSFKRRITRIMELNKLSGVPLLIKKIEQDDHFFRYVLSEITVNVTEMFRDPSFWRELRDKVIPNIIQNQQQLHIWHAGCSSGEEVFSMLILLKELQLLDRCKIYATDLDTEILKKAAAASIPLKNMEVNEKNYIRFAGSNKLDQYFSMRDGQAVLDKALLSKVTFQEQSLVSNKPPTDTRFDLVLCRNVMIYFNQNLQNKVLNLIHASLNKFGYLAIGSKESMIWCDSAHKFLVVNNEEKIFKKIKD
jgi:chemotaxis protein methyltransferase CheR